MALQSPAHDEPIKKLESKSFPRPLSQAFSMPTQQCHDNTIGCDSSRMLTRPVHGSITRHSDIKSTARGACSHQSPWHQQPWQGPFTCCPKRRRTLHGTGQNAITPSSSSHHLKRCHWLARTMLIEVLCSTHIAT